MKIVKIMKILLIFGVILSFFLIFMSKNRYSTPIMLLDYSYNLKKNEIKAKILAWHLYNKVRYYQKLKEKEIENENQKDYIPK